jgi:hypothetical protein
MVKQAGNIGSLFMIAFSFTFNPWFALAGLSLITVQTVDTKMHNLTAVQIVSIVGFIFQLSK